jgi:hypothetical protein
MTGTIGWLPYESEKVDANLADFVVGMSSRSGTRMKQSTGLSPGRKLQLKRKKEWLS